MPYIKNPQAQKVHHRGYALDGAELNYIITYHIAQFLKHRIGPVGYATYAEALAAVEGAKGEFLRRIMYPYEDVKIETAFGRDAADPLADCVPRR